MADPKTPYGPKSQVSYADPGYQSDGRARYPLDSEEHCRAAWSYINMAKNAAKYTPEQVNQIKARIKSAGKKYGVEFAEKVKAAAGGDLRAVELARPGAWRVASGVGTFTAQMLRDAADFYAASGGQAVPVALGHADDRFSGDPAFGSVTNIRYAEDDRGPVLLGDIVDMPGWLAASAPRSWPNRSIEGWQNFEYEGREYSLVVTGLAFLGVTPPAVRNIRSLADLQTALAASAARHLVASAPVDDPAAAPETSAPAADEPIDEKEAGQMDPAKIREALGLSADASDEEVKAALASAFPGKSPPPTEPPAPPTEPEPQPGPDPAPELVTASGIMRIDASAWQEREARIKRLEAQAAKQSRDERDKIIARAVEEGKFAPARREHWVRLWDADPEGTRQVIDTLARNVIPVMASGYTGADDDELDREYAHLFPPAASKGGGRRG